jgi:hypothetical protein
MLIDNLNLIDPQLYGRKFSWMRPDGSSMSRLDRILISVDWPAGWNHVSQWILNRHFSNHCLVILRKGEIDRGPSPFRFNKCWLLEGSFMKLVESF